MFTRVSLYNIHNDHCWSFNNQLLIKEINHQVCFSVNMGIIKNNIIGPIFSKGALQGQNYLGILRNTICLVE